MAVFFTKLIPVGLVFKIKADVFTKTVTQKIKRNGCFLDL